MQQNRYNHPQAPKSRYKVTNWHEYNKALVKRGSLTLWLDETVIANWHRISGKGFIYHEDVIRCGLSLRGVLKLTLRQVQGFLQSLVRFLGLAVTVPHYSTFSRRTSCLPMPKQPCDQPDDPIHLVVDATGLKVYGEGEWKVRSHGTEKGKRRTWRKLHLGVDEATGDIHAHQLTPNTVGDGDMLPALLDEVEVPLEQVSADGAYDSFKCHRAVYEREARPVIPPRKGASLYPPPNIENPPPTRGVIVKRMWEIGRKEWKKEAGYHRRSLAETAMHRYKTIIGPKMHSRTLENQKAEAAIGVHILNSFTRLGMPETVKMT